MDFSTRERARPIFLAAPHSEESVTDAQTGPTTIVAAHHCRSRTLHPYTLATGPVTKKDARGFITTQQFLSLLEPKNYGSKAQQQIRVFVLPFSHILLQHNPVPIKIVSVGQCNHTVSGSLLPHKMDARPAVTHRGGGILNTQTSVTNLAPTKLRRDPAEPHNSGGTLQPHTVMAGPCFLTQWPRVPAAINSCGGTCTHIQLRRALYLQIYDGTLLLHTVVAGPCSHTH